MVQNKLHYATHGNTAAEVIYNCADSEKEFMGLTTFAGDFPTKKDITVAKNYLTETELKVLNNLVSAYFDLAEINGIWCGCFKKIHIILSYVENTSH